MLSISLKEISKRLQNGSVLPSELCEACITRANDLRQLNAFTGLAKQTAVKQSKEADIRYKNGNVQGALDGVPVAVKDNFCTYGITTTCGSRMLENFIPRYNATMVQKLLNAGAVLIGKCNMDEFAMGSGTTDSIYGPARNVWCSGVNYKLVNKRTEKVQEIFISQGAQDDWHITGGSSGGSAVAVASGTVFAALGSDTGGSTRNPAAYCGVVGLKPTYGLLSRHGLIPLVNSMDVPGIFTRTVEDAATMLNILAGHDPYDSTTVHEKIDPVNIREDMDISRIRIGIPMEYHCTGMSEEVLDTWNVITNFLSKSGAKVKQVSMPHTPTSIVCYSILSQCEIASNMARYDGIEFGLRAAEDRSTEELYAASRSQGFNEIVRGRIFCGNYFLLQRNYHKYFEQALKVRRLIAQDFAQVWSSGIDVLLTPTTLTAAPKYSEFIQRDSQEQSSTQDYCTQPANMAGCPAITIPIRLSEQGLPLSLQLMAQNFREDLLLNVAKWLENIVNFPRLEVLVK